MLRQVYKVFAYSEVGCVSRIIDDLKDGDGFMRWEIHQGRNEEELMWVREWYPSDYPEESKEDAVSDFHESLTKAVRLLEIGEFTHVEPFVD